MRRNTVTNTNCYGDRYCYANTDSDSYTYAYADPKAYAYAESCSYT